MIKLCRSYTKALVVVVAFLLIALTALALVRPDVHSAFADGVRYEETFAETADGALPAGWTAASGTDSGAAAVRSGALTLTSAGDYNKNLMVRLPSRLDSLENFAFSVSFRYIRTTDGNDGRYLGLIVRGDLTATQPTYFQMAVRQNCAKDSGVELAERQAGGWNVPARLSYTDETLTGGKLDPERVYTAEVRVYGQKIFAYFEGKKLGSASLPAASKTGGLGLQVCNCVVEIASVTVTSLSAPKYMGLAQEYNTTGGASDPPATASLVTDRAAYDGLKVSNTRPGSAIFYLNASLQAVAADGSAIATIEEVFAKLNKKVIPIFYVRDADTAQAFCSFMTETEAEDVSVMSDDGAILKSVREICTEVRGLLDTDAAISTDAERLALRDATNRALAKTVVLPAESADSATIRYLQKRLISVWVKDADTPAAARTAVLKGVDGVIGDYAAVYDTVLSLPDGTRLKTPFVVGHRGYCPDGSTFPENSLDAALAAYEQGVDAIENDVYMTTDNHFVIAHDNEVSKFGAKNEDGSPASGTLESMTLAAVKKLYLRDGKTRIPTLEEYFDAFKDKDVLHYTEIKTFNPSFAEVFAALVAEKGVSGQINLISFSKPAVYAQLAVRMPEVSIGYLNQDRAYEPDQIETPETVLSQCVPLNATYHPFYQKVTADLVRRLNNRGIQVNPWTLDTVDNVQAGIDRGYGSLTTDEAGDMRDFVTSVDAPEAVTLRDDGAAVSLTVTRRTGEAETVPASGVVVLSGKMRLRFEDGKCYATPVAGETTCTAAFYYVCTTPLGSYVTVTQPVAVTFATQTDPVDPVEPVDPTPVDTPTPPKKGCGCGGAFGWTGGGTLALVCFVLLAAMFRRGANKNRSFRR